MGRKKKKQLKPWCWYCNREFDDEKILIQHQKSKHFKCTFCHKKLYTGPGLSIHSMQVHKEKIDKIPYALPHRCNVDLEIYGMEGIPDDDIKDHERQKSGKEDEVEEKKIKLDYNSALPSFPLPAIPGLPYMPPMSLPVMPPLQFGLAPPLFVARPSITGILPTPITRINQIATPPMPPPQQPISSPSTINNQSDQIKIEENDNIPPPPPPPPVNTDVIVQSGILHTPTFPAYSGNSENSKVILKVAKPTSSTPNIKVVLVHPDDDVPLEQIRLRLTKYASFLNQINKNPPNDLPWSKSNLKAESLNQNECKMIPPPPPPGHMYIQQRTANSQFERHMPPRPWIAPHIVQFSRTLNFGGQGY